MSRCFSTIVEECALQIEYGRNLIDRLDTHHFRLRHKDLQALLQIFRHQTAIKKQMKAGRLPAITVLVPYSPVRLLSIFGRKPIFVETTVRGMDDLGNRRLLHGIEAAPELIQSIALQMAQDQGDQFGLAFRLLGSRQQCSELFEIVDRFTLQRFCKRSDTCRLIIGIAVIGHTTLPACWFWFAWPYCCTQKSAYAR